MRLGPCVAGTHVYRVTYRIGGTGPGSYEVTRTVRTNNANIDDLARDLGRRWAGQPILRIEIVDPIEDV